MVDMIASSPPPGITSPTLLQAQQSDPRVALARMMMEKSNSDQTPLYSPWATLAKAMTSGLAGYTNVKLGQEYAQRQQDLGELTSQALKAGQTGIQGWHNPDAGQTTQADGSPMPPPVPDIQAQPPGFGAVAATLAQSKDPAAQQMALQYGMQDMQTKQAAQLAFLQKLAEKGLTLGPNGQVMALPNYGQAEAANVGPVAQAQAAGTATGTNAANAQPGIGGQAAVINATAPAKAREAGMVAGSTTAATNTANAQPGMGGQAAVINATAPAKANEAALVAGATAPIDINKAVQIALGKVPTEKELAAYKSGLDVASAGPKAQAEAQGRLGSEQEMTAFKAALDLQNAGPKAEAEAKAKLPYEVVPVHGVGAFPKSTILGTTVPAGKPPAVLSLDGYKTLPKGTQYTAPDGSIRVKQ